MNDGDLARMNRVLRHRLRNFASGIKSAASLLSKESEGVLDPGAREYFPLIINECNELDELTQRMSKLFDRVENGGPERVSAVLAVLGSEVQEAMPTLELEVSCADGDAECYIAACRSVITSLKEVIVNAAEAAPRQVILMSCAADGDMFQFTVKDEGRGIAEDDLGEIFAPFFTTKSRHVGIGLAIARKLLEEAGGSIQVGSGEGTQIEVNVPISGGNGTDD